MPDNESEEPLSLEMQQILHRIGHHKIAGPKAHDIPDAVYVIESPSAEDLMVRRGEGEALAQTLSLAGIQVEYFLAANEEMVEAAFNAITEHIKKRPDWGTAMPWIHFSAHGDKDGLELTDSSVLYWPILTRMLLKLGQQIGPVILPAELDQGIPKASLSLSSCGAFAGYLKQVVDDCPVQCIIGSDEDIGWCQSLLGFSTLYYHAISLHKAISNAVEAMNVAAGVTDSAEKPVFLFHKRPRNDPGGSSDDIASS